MSGPFTKDEGDPVNRRIETTSDGNQGAGDLPHSGERARVGPAPGDDARSAVAPGRMQQGLQTLVVILIAAIAAVAASDTWCAEVAGSRAAASSQRGVAVDIAVAGERLSDRASALSGDREVLDVQALRDEDLTARAQARMTAGVLPSGDADNSEQAIAGAPPDFAYLKTHTPVLDQMVAATVYEWSLRAAWLNNYYVTFSKQHRFSYDLTKATSEMAAVAEIDTNYNAEFQRADRLELQRRDLLYVDLALVGALALATIGHLLKVGRAFRALAASSLAVMVGSLATLLVIEF